MSNQDTNTTTTTTTTTPTEAKEVDKLELEHQEYLDDEPCRKPKGKKIRKMRAYNGF